MTPFNIRARIRQRLQDLTALFRAVNDEANHPGRPQPHMAARNPLWGGESGGPRDGTEARDAVPAKAPPPAPEGVDPYASNEVAPESEGEYWYLQGETVEEGWRETNPGETPDDEGES